MSSRRPLFRLAGVSKTYGETRRIPPQLYAECRLEGEARPAGPGWREVCGTQAACRSLCTKCWSLRLQELEIQAGVTHGILGHSGSGKTTLLNLLAMLDLPDSDSREFVFDPFGDGREPYRFREVNWRQGEATLAQSEIRRRHFGFVFQAGYLLANLTALQNVSMPILLSGARPREAERRARALLEQVLIHSGRAQALPRHLSGGEYQRVAVARALAHDPQVVFADEPTGNLDPDTAERTMEALQDWRKNGPNRTLVLITHNLSQAVAFCDHITVLSGGLMIPDVDPGTLDESKLRGMLRKTEKPPAAGRTEPAQVEAAGVL